MKRFDYSFKGLSVPPHLRLLCVYSNPGTVESFRSRKRGGVADVGKLRRKKLRQSHCSCLLEDRGLGEEREAEALSEAEFFVGIICSLVLPDTA